MTCDTRSTGHNMYTCQLPDGHSGDAHGAVTSKHNIAVWGPGYGWGPTYVGHRPSLGAPKGEAIVVMYLAREYAEGRLLPHDKAAQVASFVAALNRGRGVVIDRPARAGRNMTEASRTWRDAWWCEMPEHLRRIPVADHMDK